MSWMASERYGMRMADSGVALVQELINTRAVGGTPDLLVECSAAQEWWDNAIRQWAAGRTVPTPQRRLSDDDVAYLRRLRRTFTTFVGGSTLPPDAISGITVALAPDSDGRVRPAPTGEGTAWLASVMWSETMLAQQDGLWDRIKLCRNEKCRTAFFDASRNRNGVWHDVTRCGNVANLRASRERKRNMALREN